MKRLLFLFISPLFVFGQLSVINPSFEDPNGEGGEVNFMIQVQYLSPAEEFYGVGSPVMLSVYIALYQNI